MPEEVKLKVHFGLTTLRPELPGRVVVPKASAFIHPWSSILSSEVYPGKSIIPNSPRKEPPS